MKRRLLAICAAVSLLLCVASAVLVVRSRSVSDEVHWDTNGAQWHLMASWGDVMFIRVEPPAYFFSGPASQCPDGFRPRYDHWPAVRPSPGLAAPLGFGDHSGTFADPHSGYPIRQRTLTAPLWAFTFVFGVLPVRWVVRMRQKRRGTRAGLCPGCGYDMRATPQRCPECGREVANAAARAD